MKLAKLHFVKISCIYMQVLLVYVWKFFTQCITIVEYIIRSHEVKDNGYEVDHNGKCITVFSAPNYWYVHMLCNIVVLY